MNKAGAFGDRGKTVKVAGGIRDIESPVSGIVRLKGTSHGSQGITLSP